MPCRTVNYALYTVPVVILMTFVVWMKVDPDDLAPMTREDGWIENGTAIAYAVAAAMFALATRRMRLFQADAGSCASTMTICWSLLALFCMGEEISWGQRIFDFKTPEGILENNTHGEFNIHNLYFVEHGALGGEYGLLSIYMLLGGLGIPVAARTRLGRWLFARTYFPVLPWQYCVLWVGAYAYGKYFGGWEHIPAVGHSPTKAATEIRELLVALGTAFFAIHAFWRPSDVYVEEPRVAKLHLQPHI